METKSKKILLTILVLFVIGIIPIIAYAAGTSSGKEISADAEVSQKGVTVKIKSNIELKYIKLYRKTTDNKFILFYKGEANNVKETDLFFDREIMPDKVVIKVVVVDKNGEESWGELEEVTIPAMPSINPEETAKPSWSPSPVPTKPTPSTSPSSSSSPSASPSTSPKPTSETIRYGKETYKAPIGDKIFFLDVADYNKSLGRSQGSDCLLVRSEGKYGIIDATLSNKADRVVKHLKELGVKELEFVIVSHNHGDHVGGYKKISSAIPIKKMYVKKNYSNVVPTAKGHGTKIINPTAKTTFTFGNFLVEFHSVKDVKASDENVNCLTAVFIQKDTNKKIYFAGDLQNAKKKKLYPEINTAIEIGKVDVYKAAHHGYNYENNDPKSLKALKPTFSVLTNCKGRGGTKETVKRLQDLKSKVYWCGNGTVLLNINSSGGISTHQFKEEK